MAGLIWKHQHAIGLLWDMSELIIVTTYLSLQHNLNISVHSAQGPAGKGKPGKNQSPPCHLPVHVLATSPLGSLFPVRQKKEHLCLCFSQDLNICKWKKYHSCIAVWGIGAGNEQRHSDSGWESQALPWKGGKLATSSDFFTANVSSDNYSPADLHKFQHS